MKTAILGLIAVVMALSSCDNRKNSDTSDIYLDVDEAIDELSDSTLFKVMRSLVVDDGKLYCIEESRAQVLVLDENMQLINTIGSLGRGPFELLHTGCLSVHKDTVVVTDAGNSRMQLYLANGKHIRVDKLVYEEYLMPSNRFVYKAGTYIGEARNNLDNSLIAYKNADSIRYFGDRYKFPTSQQENIRNHRYILDGGDYIISVSNNIPIIEKYDCASGRLLSSFDLSEIEPIKSRMEETEAKTKYLPDNSYISYLSDCNIFEDKVYLLCCENIDSYQVNKVIVLSCKEEFNVTTKYVLPNAAYTSVAVCEGFLFAFCSDRSELQRFEI